MYTVLVSVLYLASTVLSAPVEQNTPREVELYNDINLKNKRDVSTVQSCLNTGNVGYRLQSSYDFLEYSTPYNTRLPYKPAVIVLPKTTQDVSTALVCAGNSSLKVQAKSGGHSYASYGLGGQDGSMVIDMESFQNVTVDGSTQIASVGTGVRLGNVALGMCFSNFFVSALYQHANPETSLSYL